jgi:hypothetical protein
MSVMKRHVYFLSGFDPKGAAYYHALYQTQAQQQSAVNGMQIKVAGRQRDVQGNSFWSVNTTSPDGSACETTYEFSRWDDLVRQNWPRSTWRLLMDMLFAYRLMWASGEIATVWRLSRKTLIGLAYPLAVLGGGLVLGLLAAAATAAGLSGRGASVWLAGAASTAVFALMLWGTLKVEDKLNTTWLVRIFSFSGKQACGLLPALETRLNEMGATIARKIRANDVDEILVVGFSVGSILGVSAVARALADADAPSASHDHGNHPDISLLTLGHCIPMLGLLPQAQSFRNELGVLGQSTAVQWIDFSSPTDWGSFALVDPVTACRVSVPAGSKVNPTMRSPRFHTLFDPAAYSRIKRNKRRMHMQYLMAGELPSDYDYFAITSGTLTLGERFTTTQAATSIIQPS